MSNIREISTFISDGDWIESQDQSDYGIRLIQTGNIGSGEYLDKPDKAKYISKYQEVSVTGWRGILICCNI